MKLGINHPWVKGILNCSNKGLCPLQRGDNLKNARFYFARITPIEHKKK
jgi:hypothetical protein